MLRTDLARGKTPGGPEFVTQAGDVALPQKYRGDAAAQLPSAPDLHKNTCKARTTTAERVLDVPGKRHRNRTMNVPLIKMENLG